MKTLCIYLSLMVGFISIGFCQSTITQGPISEKEARAIKKDSLTFSWEQGNKFVNGLENAARLDSTYQQLRLENTALYKSYQSLERERNRAYDTIIPAEQAKNFEFAKQVESQNKFIGVLESEVKRQTGLKWSWSTIALVLGSVLGIVLAPYIKLF